MSSVVEIRPQAGPQEMAMACDADVVLLGGAKGGGKSYVQRLAPIPYLGVPGFHAVIFRRSLEQIKKPGGQWDKSFELYPYLGGDPISSKLKWFFSAGSSVTFSHLQKESNWVDWQGTETTMFGFDQLEEFTQTQFLKILGCSRSTCGVRTQIWATMNPDAESWVRTLVDPWIAEDGYIDPEKNGKVFYFTVIEDEITFVDEDWRDANDRPAKSIVYFSADIWDNPALLQQDPDYLSNLMAQSLVDRERFLGKKGRGGNWNIKAVAGKVFRTDWFEVVDAVPAALQTCRYWDFASTASQNQGHDPDFTAGVKLAYDPIRRVAYVVDVVLLRGTPAEVDHTLRNTASQDGPRCLQRWQRDPGQAGVYQDQKLRQLLSGFNAMGVPSQLSKYDRAKPLSRAAEFGEVKLLRGHWNQGFLNELAQFPDGAHDDQVDGGSGAYNCLVGNELQSAGSGKFKA